MDHDVGAVLDRPAQVRRRQCVVDDQRHAGRVRNRGDGGDIEHVELRVTERLGVQRLGIGFDGAPKIFRVAGVDEGRVDAELGKGHREL